VITRTPGLQGGFIWEWKDHGLRAGGGSERLCVGGDFGDEPNDANFVADGLVSADGEPHPALHEVAWVYRPVTVTVVDGALRIGNRRSFTMLDDLEARWEVLVDGEVAGTGVLTVPPVPPHATVDAPLPDEVHALIDGEDEGEVVLTVGWRQRHDTWFAPAGHLGAWDQAVLAMRHSPLPVPVRREALASPDHVMLTDPEPVIARAPIDNDGFKLMARSWLAPGVGSRVLEQWTTAGVFDHPAGELVPCTSTVDSIEGGRFYTWRIEIPEGFADPGRVGVRWAIPRRFDHLRWYGRGPGENYPDRSRGSMIGRWQRPVDTMPYLVPQEYGLRTDVRWLACDDPGTGETLWIRAMTPTALHMAVVQHSREALHAAGNSADLAPDDCLWVHVDIAHRGVGTASCGPEVLPRYRIGPGVYEFSFWVGVTRD
jgi:beta-galactosidase